MYASTLKVILEPGNDVASLACLIKTLQLTCDGKIWACIGGPPPLLPPLLPPPLPPPTAPLTPKDVMILILNQLLKVFVMSGSHLLAVGCLVSALWSLFLLDHVKKKPGHIVGTGALFEQKTHVNYMLFWGDLRHLRRM